MRKVDSRSISEEVLGWKEGEVMGRCTAFLLQMIPLVFLVVLGLELRSRSVMGLVWVAVYIFTFALIKHCTSTWFLTTFASQGATPPVDVALVDNAAGLAVVANSGTSI